MTRYLQTVQTLSDLTNVHVRYVNIDYFCNFLRRSHVFRQGRTFNKEHGTVKLQVTKKLQVTFQPGYFGSGKVKEGGCIEIADCSSDPCHNGQCVDLEVG